MRRSISLSAVLIAAVPAFGQGFGQSLDIIRSDNIQNTMQLNIRSRSFVRAHPSLAWFVFPFEATPDYNYGYSQTVPCITGRNLAVGNAIYNRILFRNANVPMSFQGFASNHSFQRAGRTAQALVGPVQFHVSYDSSGINQKQIVFASPPTAQLSGPTANLSARLTTSQIGPFNRPRYNVTGFYIDQNGINNVNLITPIGGITFDTFLNVAPDSFTMPIARLNVPTARLTQQPKVITAASFKAYYELRLQ